MFMMTIPHDATLMPVEEFVEACMNGIYTDGDGSGRYATKNKMSDVEVLPSEVKGGEWNQEWSHVAWFNL